MSSSELVTRSFLAGDDFIIKTSPVFPGDFIPSTSMYDDANGTTETASTQTETTDATTVTPMLLELAKDKTQDDDSSTTTTEAAETSSTVTTVMTTTEDDEGETMTPLDRFVSTTGKPVETTLESEADTETTKAVKKSSFTPVCFPSGLLREIAVTCKAWSISDFGLIPASELKRIVITGLV